MPIFSMSIWYSACTAARRAAERALDLALALTFHTLVLALRACAGKPSALASVAAAGPMALSAFLSSAMKLVRFMKSSTDRPGGKTRAAAGGKHMIGAGDIIADGFRGHAAQEDRSGMADHGEQCFCPVIVNSQFEMLCSQPVDERHRLFEAFDDNNCAIVGPALPGHSTSWWPVRQVALQPPGRPCRQKPHRR